MTSVARPVADAAAGLKSQRAQIDTLTCRTLPALQALQSDWADLLLRCPDADLFMTPAWHLAWWKAFGAGATPAVIAFREGARLLAVMPLCRYRDRLRGFPVRVTGTYNNQHASRTGILVEPGHEPVIALALARHLLATASEWDVIMLRQLPADAGWLQPFFTACAEVGLRAFGPTPGIGRCVLPLGGDWLAYLASKTGHFRARLKENLRRVERSGQIRYRGSDVSNDDFTKFESLEALSWKHEHDSARLGPAGWAFQREVAMSADAGMRCHNLFLEIDGKVVGALHAVGYRDVAYSMQMLFDESVRALYPGRALFSRHVADMFDDGGYRTLDLNGNSPFCCSWSDQQLAFVGLQIYSQRPYSALLSRLKRTFGRHG